VLVDPFMGSGTSAVAAVKCGLEYIGFDIDTEYRQFAQDRIADFETHDARELAERDTLDQKLSLFEVI
jgi:site-specific DNA-methyltransferase (adenine-specific)